MEFRNGTPADLPAISALENICFPPSEAASYASFSQRLHAFPNHFWLLEVHGELVGFINGMVTNNETINDDMFNNAGLHDEQGKWQSIFGIAVAPKFRKNGYAGLLIKHFINKAKEENRTGVTLTCKEYLVPYYERYGFTDLGISRSVHGGAVWHDLNLNLR